VAKKTILFDNLCESTVQISVTRPEEKKLKNDEDYELGEQSDPWDKFALSEINDQYYAVAVGKNENSFGIYADVRKCKEEIEVFPASLYPICSSSQIFERISPPRKGEPRDGNDRHSTCSFLKKIMSSVMRI
jgi:hypothetical protein